MNPDQTAHKSDLGLYRFQYRLHRHKQTRGLHVPIQKSIVLEGPTLTTFYLSR